MKAATPTRSHAMVAILRLFLAERPGALIGGAALAAMTLAAGIGLLGLSGWFITATALAGLTTATALTFDVFAPSAGIRLLAITRTAARYGERLVTHDAALAVIAGLRERLFRGWAQPGAAGRLADRPSRLLFRLTLDIDALDSLYLRVLVPVTAALVVTLGAIGLLGLTDHLVVLIFALIVIPAGVAIPFIGLRLARSPARRRAHVLEVLRTRAIDLIAGQTELIMAGRLTAKRGEFTAAEARLAQADDGLNRVETVVSAAFSIAGTALLALMLVTVAYLVGIGTLSAPVAALVLLVAVAALDPFAALRRGVVEAERALIAARRVAPRLRRADAPARRRRAVPAAGLSICLQGVDLTHPGTRAPVLRSIDLTLAAGERLAVLGASGAGKSTLLAALAGELSPAAGRLATRPATLLTQRTELFHDSLRGNLLLAYQGASDVELMAALAGAGLDEMIANLPAGLDSRLGEGGIGLSGGQARRLAVARLLLRGAPLWLLDEPTEGLDGATARDVLARLKAQSEGCGLVIATHLRREAELADHLIVLADGGVRTFARRGEPAFAAALAALRPD